MRTESKSLNPCYNGRYSKSNAMIGQAAIDGES